MNTIWFLLSLLLYDGVFSSGYGKNISSRPAVVKIGAIFSFNSTVGRVAKFAIEEAVKDVNSDSNILQETELTVTMHDSNCSGFLGFVEALRYMETDIAAIIGPQCSTASRMISHFANELQVPLISFAATDPTLSSLQFPYFVRMTQSDSYQMAAVAEIVDYYGWKAIVAIYVDDDYGRNGVYELNDKLARRRCRISYQAGISPSSGVNHSEIMDLLVNIELMESRIIILHVGADLGFMIFSVAHYLGMMSKGYVWIATDWLASELDSNSPLPQETMDSMQGVLVLRQHTPDSDRKSAFLSRWKDLTGGSLGMNTQGLYAYDSVWIVAHAVDAFYSQGGIISFSNDSSLQAMSRGNLHLDALRIFDGGKLLLSKILDDDIAGLTGHLRFGSDRSLIQAAYDILNVIGTGYRRIGYWSNDSGLSTLPPERLDKKPLNHPDASRQQYSVIWPGDTMSTPRGWVFPKSGKLLKIGVPNRVNFREFVTYVRETNTFHGFCIDVFTAAVNSLPYAVAYEFVPFGDGYKNPSYTNLLSLVSTGYIDAVVGDIAISKIRTDFLDFTQPYAASRLVVVAPYKKINTGGLGFLQPLTLHMWIVTGSFLLLVGIVMWVLEHRCNDEFRGPPKNQVMTILSFGFSTLLMAPRENIVSTLGRMVIIILFFVVLILNKSYTASLGTILTVQQQSSPIKGIQSLIRSDGPIGYQKGSFSEYYLSKELKIPKSRLIPLSSPEEYVEALRKGPKRGGVVALVEERPYVELFLSNHCSFKIVGEDFTKSSWGFAFPRDSPLAVDLSTKILELAENGDLQRIHDKWLTKNSCDVENSELESYQLHLISFWGLFLICGIVCVIALFIYFARILIRFRTAGLQQSASTHHGSSGSSHLRRLLLLIDEKEGRPKRRMKRLKLDKSLLDKDRDEECGTSSMLEITVASGSKINSKHV